MIGIKKQHSKMYFENSCWWGNIKTILSEVESVINDRPMTYISSNINDLTPMTHLHFYEMDEDLHFRFWMAWRILQTKMTTLINNQMTSATS